MRNILKHMCKRNRRRQVWSISGRDKDTSKPFDLLGPDEEHTQGHSD